MIADALGKKLRSKDSVEERRLPCHRCPQLHEQISEKVHYLIDYLLSHTVTPKEMEIRRSLDRIDAQTIGGKQSGSIS